LAAASRLHADAVRRTAILKRSVDELESRLQSLMNRAGLRAVGNESGNAKLKPKVGYHAKDWGLIQEFIADTGNWQVMKKALSSTALHEIETTAGILPPGIAKSSWDDLDFEVNK
jgi:hypothetical protein